MRVAYLVNQYPKVSHSFIRREILALERRGVAVERFALRGWDAELVDDADVHERSITRYVLQDGWLPLARAVFRTAAARPRMFAQALRTAVRMSRRAERALAYHLIYLAEACIVARWCRLAAVDHLHAHFGTNSAEVAMLASCLGGVPYSFTVHGPEEFDKAQFIGLAEKAQRAAFIVTVSSFGRSQMYRWIDAAQWAKVHVVHCGLDPSFFDVDCAPFAANSTLVCVGRLCEQKGQLLLVRALAAVLSRGHACNLVLAGDGEMRPAIEALIDTLGLNANVRITGWIGGEQVQGEVAAARALVLPSFAEGLPVVLMEAMALRRPVLSTYVAGIPELVRPGESGWLFAAGDVEELASAMIECLEASPERLAAMGDAARRRVRERHCIDTEVARLAALMAGASQEAG